MRFNPLLDRYNQVDQDVDRLIFSSLVKFDATGMPQPDLAETWSYNSDGTRFTFSLRPNAYWHDGTPVTTQDIAFTISLMKSENELVPNDLRQFWSEIQVDLVSDTVIEFALPECLCTFFGLSGLSGAAVTFTRQPDFGSASRSIL